MSGKLKSIRAGHRSVISKLLNKFEEIRNSEDTDGSDTEEVSNILDNILKKQTTLAEVNDKILDYTQESDIEDEIVSTDEYTFNLESNIRDIRKYLQNSKSESHLNPNAKPYYHDRNICNITQQQSCSTREPVYSHPNTNPMPQTYPSQNFSHTEFDSLVTNVRSSSSSLYSRLPKLNLPTFDGDVLEWQSFWDSYETSVHTNPTLSNVQKFNYLKSLLRNEALQSITGFSLTNANYEKAISLLCERYGQETKIVQTYMQALLDLDPPSNTLDGLRRYYDKNETYIRGLESLGQMSDSNSSLLVPVILNKLPGEIRKNLAREHGTSSWSLSNLRQGLNNELKIMEAGRKTETIERVPTAAFLTTSNTKSNTKYRNKSCVFCDGAHFPASCTKVAEINSRIAIVKSKSLCFNCLGNHKRVNCKSIHACKICQKYHHTSLCKTAFNQGSSQNETVKHNAKQRENAKQPETTKQTEITQQNPKQVSSLHSSIESRGSVLLKTAVAPVSFETHCTDANILFDEGSQRSFITESLANELELKPFKTETIQLSAFGDKNQRVKTIQTSRVCLHAENGNRITLDVLIVPEIAADLKTHTKKASTMKHLQGLKLAHPTSRDENFNISLLIGADYYWDIVEDRIIRGDGPTAVKSKVGYLLSGPISNKKMDKKSSTSVLNVMISHINEEVDLEKFWKLESMGIENKENQKEKEKNAYLKQYEDSSITYRGNRYYVKLPWKNDHSPLPTNENIARNRTENVIKRLSKDPNLLLKYSEIIDEQERRGFIEKVPKNMETNTNNKVHYIPHHAVKKDSTTTPVRIVYDCSCKQNAISPSLNECLSSEPPILNDLTGILLRFRMKPYAVSTDIEKAFLNVGLELEDRDATRFFWLSDPVDPSSPLEKYRFKSVLFGATCSPFILGATIDKHLRANECEFTQTLLDDLYVDNILSSFLNENDVLRYFRSSRDLFSKAGFNLRSWSSNSPKLQDLAKEEGVLDSNDTVKILGLRWNTSADTISFAMQKMYTSENYLVTKREILQFSSKIYDPLGLLSPVTVRSKMLMQSIWERKFNWDVPLPSDLVDQWKEISRDIESACGIQIQRYNFKHEVNDTDQKVLHVFSDASKKAYGAVAYIVQGNQTSLLMARNRVAPIKKLTIPQLELMAALIGAKLYKHLLAEINFSHAKFWSDSQITLQWISSQKCNRKAFIENRVKEIRESTKDCEWKYCPTDSNPADLLTRGISFAKFLDNDLWVYGPKWLSNTDQWPKWNSEQLQNFKILTTVTEEKDNDSSTLDMESTGIQKCIESSRFSSYKRLLHVTAYVLRFISNCKASTKGKVVGPLTAQEIKNASFIWIRDVQRSEYSDIIQILTTKISQKHCLIRQLKLYVDNKNLVRCRGRIHNAPVNDETKFPLLLSSNNDLTRLIILDAHTVQLHSGLESTVTLLRQNFWIPKIRQAVKKILFKCIICRKINGRPYSSPSPPPLPKERLMEAPPFTVTGVDFAGPLHIKDKFRNGHKVYICLFTCANTRAIHLETVNNLSAETFILAFRRFCSRKSLPKIMLSDNATTYIASSKEIEQLSKSTFVHDKLNNVGVTWKFIPKRAPWYGGFWERMVGLTKNSLKKVLGNSCVNLETLQTVLTEIECIINDRPLTYISADPLDEEPLTPSQLLYGRRITRLPYSDYIDTDYSYDITCNAIRKQYKLRSDVIQHFWNRWKKEYLTSLREYTTCMGHDEQKVKIGDVVQVQEDCPKSTWKMAVIEGLHVGDDGQVRSATLRTKNGVTSRPLCKLYPLELTVSSSLVKRPNTRQQCQISL